MLGRDERADLGAVVEGVTDPDPAGDLEQPLEEFVSNRLVQEDPRRRHADLAVLEVDPGQDVVHGGLEVGIRADHERALAAELHDRRRHVLGRCAQDVPGGLDAAGEADLGDVGVRDEGGADARPEAGHDVDDAGRHEVGGTAHELDDARGGELGRLEHDGVAGRERRARA